MYFGRKRGVADRRLPLDRFRTFVENNPKCSFRKSDFSVWAATLVLQEPEVLKGCNSL